MSKFLPTCIIKRVNLEDFHSNKYSSNSSKEFGLEVDLEYPKE